MMNFHLFCYRSSPEKKKTEASKDDKDAAPDVSC